MHASLYASSWLGSDNAAHRAAGERVEHDDGAVVSARRATGARREPCVGRLAERGVEDTRACSTVHAECMSLDSTSHGEQHGVESQQRMPVSVVPAASRAIPCPSSASSRPRPESIPRSFHCRLRTCQQLNTATGLHDDGDGLALLR